jgi:hypothetical protein
MSAWRQIEQTITDHLRRRGCAIHDVCGTPFLGTTIHDDVDDRVIEQRLVLNLEDLAKAVAQAIADHH